MDATLEAIQDAAAEQETETQPDSAQPDDAMIETQLAQEISALWSDHVRLSGTRRATSKELRQVRARLAERLFAMKQILCRAGRAGQWRSWLRQQHIPRSTADRLAMRHGETLCGGDGNVPTGAIPGSPEDRAETLAKSVWQRVGKLLTTGESILRFIGCFAEISGVGHEQRAEGLVIFSPVPKTADAVTGTGVSAEAACPAPLPPEGDANPAHAPAADPAPQPSSDTPSSVEEPPVETTATPLAVEQVAAVADAGASGAA